jgi:hypothetical protein
LHAVANRRAEQVGGSAPGLNELLDLVGPNQQFMEGDSPFKA